MPLAEIVFDFYDRLKTVSRGYASFDYAPIGMRVSKLVSRHSPCLSLLSSSPKAKKVKWHRKQPSVTMMAKEGIGILLLLLSLLCLGTWPALCTYLFVPFSSL